MAGKKSSENMTALPGAICEPGGVASTSGALSTFLAFGAFLAFGGIASKKQTGRNAIAIKLKITNVNKINGLLSDKKQCQYIKINCAINNIHGQTQIKINSAIT